MYASFDNVDQFSVNAVNNYEEAILQTTKDDIKIKSLLLCSPHNPLGKCYPVAALEAYFKLCNKYKIHLISDEIYCLSMFEVKGSKRTSFTSMLSIDPTGLLRTDQIHVLYGISKVRYKYPSTCLMSCSEYKIGFWCCRSTARVFGLIERGDYERYSSNWVRMACRFQI